MLAKAMSLLFLPPAGQFVIKQPSERLNSDKKVKKAKQKKDKIDKEPPMLLSVSAAAANTAF